ncbi:MAG: serine threonine- kinase Sgk2 [Lasallia pustulata]|uniref:EKC/KEOPS complex subunit BUD32 n=1 Tax=Lasallia pustulata TaxID=136370 RepID=A0A5M8PWH9_9LECA|nr:MAG: serine threonine- kinase Sgk2 [Lasallia pustulata]
MAHLNREERDTINENPLGDSLSGVREALREAERNTHYEASQSDDSTVRLRVQKGDVEYKHFRPLSQLVIKQAPDVDIWAAVVALVRLVSYSSPPPSLPPSFDTPITHTSASQQGSEQTRREDSTRNILKDENGTSESSEIWQSAKSRYSDSDKRWTQIPAAPTQDEVWAWLLNLQQDLLAGERAAYFTSDLGNKVGAEASRQLDLLVKRRSDEAAGEKHDWRDVLAIGELKKSDQKDKKLWLQVGSIVRNVFASQPTRLFVHAFTLTGTEMETWIFDRSGPYSGATFDVHEEPEKFIQVMCAYLMMSDKELGLDTFTKAKGNRLLVSMPVEARTKRNRQLELDPNPIAHQRSIVCRGTSCFLAKPIGAAEFDRVVKYSWTSSMRPPEADLLNKANERGVKGLAKVVGYCEEVTSISKLREGLVFSTPHKFRGVPRSANTSFSQSQPPLSHHFNGLSIASNGQGKSTDCSSHPSKRSQLNSQLAKTEQAENGVSYPVQKPQGTTSLVQQNQAPYDNRILRILAISPAGRSISQFKSVVELLEGLRDALKVHRSLYMDGKILHRDISENNIIITDPGMADGFKGMLIDLDLAKEEGKGPSGARHRTGTMEFMAIEVLQGTSHTYRHDIEAFFYVLIWLCARRGWALAGTSKKPPTETILSHWYTGTYKDIARNKRGDMDKDGLEVILEECSQVFDCVKPLCRIIRDVLFSYKNGRLFTGTPQDPNILYDPIIEAFDDTISGLG